MKNLYLRIYLTIVASLLVFALVAGFLAQHHIEQERREFQTASGDRAAAWAALIENSLPPVSAPEGDQRVALLDWAQRLRLPLALDNPQGGRVATSEQFARHEIEAEGARRTLRIPLVDGRALWIWRPVLMRGPGSVRPPDARGSGDDRPGGPPGIVTGRAAALAFDYGGPPLFVGGLGLAAALLVLFMAVALGAYPVVRRLTRRLESLKLGVEAFGAGALSQRVDAQGRDEIAAVAISFNRAADRIEQLLRSHQSLLANASHELRSPLARLKMAVAMMETAGTEQRGKLRDEINTNIGELDALVEEVLLASRLDAQAVLERQDPVDLIGLAAEEGARVGAQLQAPPTLPPMHGDERLLRRALRNLLENARRYGGGDISLSLTLSSVQPSSSATSSSSASSTSTTTTASSGRANPSAGMIAVHVCDRGPGVPEAMRERIFEPFFRLPGHAEQAGGVGLGLSLVKQIAANHDGGVRCDAREGGGSCFVLWLPAR